MEKLKYVKTFLKDIYESTTIESELRYDGSKFLSRKGYGTIFFTDEEAKKYNEILSQLMGHYSSDRLFSRRAIEKELEQALFNTFGRFGSDQPPFSERLENALKELVAHLNREISSYTIFVPIAGADTKGLPFVFGKLRFVVFNESQLLKFRNASRKHQICTSEMKIRFSVIQDLRNTELWQTPCAVVQVNAKDSEAAEQIAVRETQGTIDALNFFSDLTPYQHGYVFMPGERSRAITTTPILEDSNSWTLPRRVAGPLAPFDFTKLREAKNLKPVLKRVSKILKEEGLMNKVDEVLLSAVRWAGRAATECRQEQAFLWYAIALESAMLPNGNTQEIAYRLRMRVAHLLTTELSVRKEIVQLVKELYQIRSKIVHNGWYELSSAELEQMWRICKESLLCLLTHSSIKRLYSINELEQWFEERLLR